MEEFSVEVKNHMSVIEDEDADINKRIIEELDEDAAENEKKHS